MQLLCAVWGMARPLIMGSVIQVYLAGTLIARARGQMLDEWAFAGGLVALLLVALSIHYANEYADHETDALTRQTPFSGGSGVLPRGLVPRVVALRAAWIVLALGMLAVLLLAAAGTLPVIAFPLLAAGAFCGWMYSLPPLALAWRGWGELANALLGGSLLPLYGYAVQWGAVHGEVVLACLPFAGLVFLNLLATTYADRRADGLVGKFTLAATWPAPRLRWLYGGIAVLSMGVLLALPASILPRDVLLLSLLAIPLVGWGFARYTRTDAPHASVYAMIVLLAAQMVGWYAVGG